MNFGNCSRWKISKPAALRNFTTSTTRRRLDQRFLADLKRWRLLLANGFALRNQTRPLADLTLASQQLLDRFLFCRMLETHRLVEHNKLARAFAHYEALYGEAGQEKTFAEVPQRNASSPKSSATSTPNCSSSRCCATNCRIDNLILATVVGHEPLPPNSPPTAALNPARASCSPSATSTATTSASCRRT